MLNTLEGLDKDAEANIKEYNSNPDFRKNLRKLIIESGSNIDGIISDLGNIRSLLHNSIFVELGTNLKDGSKNNEIIAALKNKLISEKES
jgi:hypothetical protein